MELQKSLGSEFKSQYVQLIASGHVESTALKALETDWLDFFEVYARDPEFRNEIEKARESRADKWIDDIAISLTEKYYTKNPDTGAIEERPPLKEELSRDKLFFEKRKFLAQADNPDKYGNMGGGKNKVSVAIDLSDFKLLTPQESIKVLNSDPFNKMVAIEAEFTEETKSEEE